MLVDNGVEGDSRVQKQARSAAAAGWDVTLIGFRTRSSRQTRWTIGEAQVRLVTVPSPLFQHQGRFRRSWRRPLAYPPGPTAAYRRQLVRARRAEVRTLAGRGWPGWTVLGARGVLKGVDLWVRLRAAQLERLEAARDDPRAPLTRLGIWWWRAVLGARSWRRLDPALWDFELALGPVVDGLRPDIVHANDYRMIGVGARAKLRAAAAGRDVKLVWDAHELVSGIKPRPGNPRWLPAQEAHEREFARFADAVVTVSPMLADVLQSRHRLAAAPAVVLNAPVTAFVADDLREHCGIEASTPLLAYSGGINSRRGLDLVVEALPFLPGVHVALVSLHPSGVRTEADVLVARAEELGVTDRVHFLPYVPHDQVAPYLAGADVAISPLQHTPNHEVALTNKFFEAAQARLPQVVSDVRALAEMIRSTGVGEVFRAGDVADFARAVRVVLDSPERYREAYSASGLLEQWTWERQAEILDEVYTRVIAR
jgi:glycosyltransferase involved in cell wall biosynthesis